MSYQEVAEGELAAVVTYLEMLDKPELSVPQSQLRLTRIAKPDLDEYRDLFRSIGARWLWFSRLVMNDAKLGAIIHDERVELFVVEDAQGKRVGMLELDFRKAEECELAFIGLVPDLAGQGHGKWLLAQAVEGAWREGVRRVHVHTCSLDHPAALSAYRSAGFTAHKRKIERFLDPRLLGHLPADCAPQVPLLGTRP